MDIATILENLHIKKSTASSLTLVSYQLDDSASAQPALDMRLTGRAISAYDLVNNLNEEEISGALNFGRNCTTDRAPPGAGKTAASHRHHNRASDIVVK
jgi:hypothetical protein